MNKWKNYLRSALCSIGHNKVYALFCVIGTAFTFVFIIIMLQLVYDTTTNKAPFVNGDRTIVFSIFQDMNGRDVGGIILEDDSLVDGKVGRKRIISCIIIVSGRWP